MNYFANILNDISSVLLPRVCFGCTAHLSRGEVKLCTSCRNDLPLTEFTFNEENPVDRIFFGRTDIKKASSFLFFSETGIVKQLIHNLKYRNQPQIGALLGAWYGELLVEENSIITEIDVVVPVPLHRKKLRKRGYNQVSLFAKEIATALKADLVEHVLIKTANTKTQTTKNRLNRWQNNTSLYIIKNSESLENKKVLLVDDVITTGATIEICAATLLKIPGIQLYIASMAVVPLN